jgi:hypothetical protein
MKIAPTNCLTVGCDLLCAILCPVWAAQVGGNWVSGVADKQACLRLDCVLSAFVVVWCGVLTLVTEPLVAQSSRMNTFWHSGIEFV